MQNNSLVRTFAILFGLVSLYQLSFTFIASNQEKKARDYSNNIISESKENYLELRNNIYNSYLDSIGDIGLYGFTSYNDSKNKELNKGLDLKGGINVILQISIRDVLKGLAENTKDQVFNQSLDEADLLQKSSDEPYVESFFIAFDKNKKNESLSDPSIYGNKTLSDEINFEMTDIEVQSVIRRKVDESIVSAFEVLRKRIDKFGVTQPNIQRLGSSGRILVELPGAKDVGRIKNLLQSTAQLEFWETVKSDQLSSFLIDANEVVKLKQGKNNDKPKQDTQESQIDELLADVVKNDSITKENNPILDLVVGFNFQGGGPVLAQFLDKDKQEITNYLDLPEVRRVLPAQFRYIKFVWGKKSPDSDVVDLYVLKSNRDGTAPLSGGVVVDAVQSYDALGNAAVNMQMNAKGARVWENLTEKAFKQSSSIAIVLDDIVYSAPGVSRGAISGGRSEITGNFTLNEAIDLANVLRAGKLPASAEIIQSEIVGPSLGREAIESGIYSFIIALILVLLWMIFYYGSSGIFANIALVLNILLIFGVIA